ncbi:MAG: DUF2520 domain-containing protein [Bacteroidales bacterium]|nr:DUF2520 domain-containing protein [Bacteroidales bacterium]
MEQRVIRKVGVIGQGHVGTHLFDLLREKGVSVHKLVARQLKDCLDNVMRLDSENTLWLLTIKDDAYEEVISYIPAELKGIMTHTSGTMHLDILKKFRWRGVMYPFQTFRKEVPLHRKDFLFVIESDHKEIEVSLMKFALMLTGHACVGDAIFRRRLHIAGILTSNFVNYLISLAWEWLSDYPSDLIQEALIPLMIQTVERIKDYEPFLLQTGPAARNDRHVIQMHLDLLKTQPELFEIYVFLTNRILKKYGYPELPK